jgi:hypothetical protein
MMISLQYFIMALSIVTKIIKGELSSSIIDEEVAHLVSYLVIILFRGFAFHFRDLLVYAPYFFSNSLYCADNSRNSALFRAASASSIFSINLFF